MADENKTAKPANAPQKPAKPEAAPGEKGAAKAPKKGPAEAAPAAGAAPKPPSAPAPGAPVAPATPGAPGAPGAPAKAPEAAAPAGAVAGTAPTAAELLADEMAGKKIIKAKGAKNISVGVAHILATFNNTQVCITDMQGNVIGWSSAGRVGFKGFRKSTAFAAQQVAQDAARQAMSHGMREVEVQVKGPGSGREFAI